MMATFGLAWLAGVLSTLSPCVLPLLPLVLGAAASQHRFGPLALAGGLAISFVVIGLFVATIGFGIGLDSDVFRNAAAVMMVLIGIVLVVPNFQARRRTGRGLDRAALRGLFDGRPAGPVRCRASAWRGLESLRGANAGRCLPARR